MKIQVEYTMKDRRVIYPYVLKEKDHFERFFEQVASLVAEKGDKEKAKSVTAGTSASVSESKLVGKLGQDDVDTEDSTDIDTSRDLSRSSEGLSVSEEDIVKMSKLAIAHKVAPLQPRQRYLVSN
jgi:hypothetical protein